MGFIEIVEDNETFELALEESVFVLRRFDSSVLRDIEKRHTKKGRDRRTGQPFKDTDDYAVNEDLLDYMLIDWRGIKSPVTGEDVPCSKSIKSKLPGSVKIQIVEACDADSITTEHKKKDKPTT